MISLALTRLSKGLISYTPWSNKGKKQNEYKRAVLAIVTVAILVSSTAIAKPALAATKTTMETRFQSQTFGV
jgi:hypothetical protein